MKRILFLFLFVAAVLGVNAQDKKVAISGAYASSYQDGNEAKYALDGNTSTIWHSSYSGTGTSFPVTFIVNLKQVSHIDYMRYIPRQDGTPNGNWNEVDLYYATSTNSSSFTKIGTYKLGGSSAVYDFIIPDGGVECGRVRFTIKSGANGFASAAEIEAYEIDNTKTSAFEQYFEDDLYTVLKPGITSSNGIADSDVKALVDNLLADAAAYKKFRVGEYEPYMTTSTLRNNLKVSSQYNNYENPTGVYLKAGESCIVVASGIGEYNVGLKIKNWLLNESSSAYSLKNGLNVITATTEGNVFVNYYTDDFENAPNVKVHFVNAPVQGYWDQETMTNSDWKAMLKDRASNDSTIIITRSRHAQLAYPVCSWLKHCPTNVDSLMTLYEQTQWAERDILGLEKYGRQVKNRQLFYATNYGFMAAGGDGAYCHIGSLGGIMTPDAKNFDFWGVGHEWGHNNQVTPGFKWSGCGETTNNIYAAWAQLNFTGNRDWLRLEDETSGIDVYKNTRGGRMQTYFEEGIRKGVAWQLQDGPDYHGTVPEKKTLTGYDANGNSIGTVTTTSRNYDHFVKLVPFWQLTLWGTLAGKSPDIIPMVIEGIRSDASYGTKYNTNGKQQINWMKLACDSTGLNLLPFFEKAGMLKPINAYIEDYSAGWNVISVDMIDELKDYVRSKGYVTPKDEINYINAHNFHIYRDNLALEVPSEYGYGCKDMGNGTVRVEHAKVKNAVAFETYDGDGVLTHITMYGLAATFNSHSDTKVLFTGNSAYIVAVGYDGTRKMIYGKANEVKGLEPGLFYNISSKNDGTALTCGTTTTVELTGDITWSLDRVTAKVNTNPDQVWFWEAVDGGFLLKNVQTGMYFSCASGDNISDLKGVDEASLLEAVCVDEEQSLYAFRLVGSNNYLSAVSSKVTGVKFGSFSDESNLWKVQKVTNFKFDIPKAKVLAACYPFAMTIPDGVTAYVVTEAAKWTYNTTEYNYAFIEEVKGDVVPAYMPVIYAGNQATYETTILPDDNTPFVENNLLHGVTIRAYFTKGEFLATLATTTAAGAKMTLKTSSSSGVTANKAYLLKSEIGNVTTVYLADKQTVTSIDGVEVDEAEVEFFDLNGVKVVIPEKNGVYVTSSGKKILVK
ncbi:MAG: M60 family metallopeptidase [Bacteroidaceae bacterium]|nr:M60 family metallopeptidase [Bacteroidaceae bacterium]